ncbi:MAG: DUF2164 family protein [bacterium]|nr:DUF2164 family protein [bacterium]
MKEKKDNLLSDEKRKKTVDAVIAYFKDARDEEIGVIAAEDLLDYMLMEVGVDIYQKAINDSKKFLKDRFEDIDTELDLLVNK